MLFGTSMVSPSGSSRSVGILNCLISAAVVPLAVSKAHTTIFRALLSAQYTRLLVSSTATAIGSSTERGNRNFRVRAAVPPSTVAFGRITRFLLGQSIQYACVAPMAMPCNPTRSDGTSNCRSFVAAAPSASPLSSKTTISSS